MGCGGSKDAGMPDTLKNWTMLFAFIQDRLKAKPRPTSPLHLALILEVAEFTRLELKDPELAYQLLNDTLVTFHTAKAEEEKKEEEEAKTRKDRSKRLSRIDREVESEIDENIKRKQASRTIKIVIRFAQRKLQIWNEELKKEKITSGALKDTQKYAVVDGDGKDDDDSDDEEESKGDPFTKGWAPMPKENINLDYLDVFLAGDLDYPSLNASDPLGLFFKLRYGVRLAEQKLFPKAIEALERPLSVASEAYREIEAATSKELKNAPKKRKSVLAREAEVRDPNQDLPDVISMSKTKLQKFRLAHDK